MHTRTSRFAPRIHAALLVLALATGLSPLAAAQWTHLVSRASDGTQNAGSHSDPRISADGRWVVYWTGGAQVPGDANGTWDIYRVNVDTETVARVSVSTAGGDPLGWCSTPDVSADGRYVSFFSTGSDLAPGDTNGTWDIFVRDMAAGTTEVASRTSTGGQSTASLQQASRICGDGRVVLFASAGTDVTPGLSSGQTNVFARDRAAGTTTLVSSTSTGAEAPSFDFDVSLDGRWAVFTSGTPNVVPGVTGAHVFRKDLQTGAVALVDSAADSTPGTGSNTYLPTISADGRWVAFRSNSSNLVPGGVGVGFSTYGDVYVKDMATGAIVNANRNTAGALANSGALAPELSHDGLRLAFQSAASNLEPADNNGYYDIYVRTLSSGVTRCASLSYAGGASNNSSLGLSLSGSGRRVAFFGFASNLVASDVNGNLDVFVTDGGPSATPETYCTAKVNSPGCTPAIGWSGVPSYSGANGFVVSATSIKNGSNGILLYGTSGQAYRPFGGGWLCVYAPVRTYVQNAGGTPYPAIDCTGGFAFDFGALLQSGSNPALLPGVEVCAQFWSRDGGFPAPNSIGLTDALSFVIQP